MKQWWINLNKTDVRNLLAFVWVASTIWLVSCLLLHAVPTSNYEIVYMTAGGYMSYTGIVMSYFFGSSKSDTKEPTA